MAKLDIKLADGSQTWIETAGDDANRDLEDFLARQRMFASEWVQVGTPGGRMAHYVRYDQIIEVKARVS